jgi:large subunit ribosomal protein L15
MSMIHEITSLTPGHKRSKRKGRGRSSGKGKTSGRGTKGSKARVGEYIKPTYEGGQTEIAKRFPKRGFSNVNFERKFYVVNVAELARFDDGATIDAAALIEAGLVPDTRQPVKILGDGEIGKKLTVMAGWYSKSAHEKIAQAGGAAQNLKGENFEFPKPKKKFVPREGGAKKSKKAEKAEAAEAAPAEPAAAPPEAAKE